MLKSEKCGVEGCERELVARGLCSTHYHHWNDRGMYADIVDARTINKGATKHPLYSAYSSMIARCHNPDNKDYKWYGGKGISVCEAWRNDFWQFVEDVGTRPKSHVLDRIDSEGDYAPGNVQWITQKENIRRARHTKITIEDAREIKRRLRAKEYSTQSALGEEYGISPQQVSDIKYGRSWADA